MNKLVIASNNEHKVRELKQLLKPLFTPVVSLTDEGINIEITEDGETFYDNALIKAKKISEILNVPVLADDSGLVVNALGNLPGVRSARFSGDKATDDDNNKKLLNELKNAGDRRAHFVSVALIYFPGGRIISGEGKAYGRILHEKTGVNGFGYDSLFYSDELHKTFAEASAEEKNRVSHRARAVKSLMEKL